MTPFVRPRIATVSMPVQVRLEEHKDVGLFGGMYMRTVRLTGSDSTCRVNSFAPWEDNSDRDLGHSSKANRRRVPPPLREGVNRFAGERAAAPLTRTGPATSSGPRLRLQLVLVSDATCRPPLGSRRNNCLGYQRSDRGVTRTVDVSSLLPASSLTVSLFVDEGDATGNTSSAGQAFLVQDVDVVVSGSTEESTTNTDGFTYDGAGRMTARTVIREPIRVRGRLFRRPRTRMGSRMTVRAVILPAPSYVNPSSSTLPSTPTPPHRRPEPGTPDPPTTCYRCASPSSTNNDTVKDDAGNRDDTSTRPRRL